MGGWCSASVTYRSSLASWWLRYCRSRSWAWVCWLRRDRAVPSPCRFHRRRWRRNRKSLQKRLKSLLRVRRHRRLDYRLRHVGLLLTRKIWAKSVARRSLFACRRLLRVARNGYGLAVDVITYSLGRTRRLSPRSLCSSPEFRLLPMRLCRFCRCISLTEMSRRAFSLFITMD